MFKRFLILILLLILPGIGYAIDEEHYGNLEIINGVFRAPSIYAENYYSDAIDGERYIILPDNTVEPTAANINEGFYSYTNRVILVEAGTLRGFLAVIEDMPTDNIELTNGAGYLTTETDPLFTAWDKDYNDLINTPTIPTQETLSVDDLILLSGVPEGSANLGFFTGNTITDNSTNKTALQELETGLEAHSVASHSDTIATGAELNELVGGSETTLHSHAGSSSSNVNLWDILHTDLTRIEADTRAFRLPFGVDWTSVFSECDGTSDVRLQPYTSATQYGTYVAVGNSSPFDPTTADPTITGWTSLTGGSYVKLVITTAHGAGTATECTSNFILTTN